MKLPTIVIPYPDFRLQEIIDPDQFNVNNAIIQSKINDILEVLNSFQDEDGASNIGLIPVQDFTSDNVQDFLEELLDYIVVNYRSKADSASSTGASTVGTSPISGVTGTNVQAMLANLKSQINSITLGQIPDGSITDAKLSPSNVSNLQYGVAKGANQKTITLAKPPTALFEGLGLSFKNETANTGSVSLNINGLGAKSVMTPDMELMKADDLKAGSVYTVRYGGSVFILQGKGGGLSTLDKSQLITNINNVIEGG